LNINTLPASAPREQAGSLAPRGASVALHRVGIAARWLVALWLSGCAELPTAPSGGPPATFLAGASVGATQAVGVLIAGWHTGLLLPSDELGVLKVLQHDPATPYVSLGWGNRRFYMARHPGSGDALAALLPSSSVLLVQTLAHASDAVPAEGRIKWVCIDRAELWRLQVYLHDSLQWRLGQPLVVGAGPLPHGRFYASSERYDAFHTCNTWTLAALQFAGLPVMAEGVLFAAQVARRIQALPACPPASG